MGIIGGIMLNW